MLKIGSIVWGVKELPRAIQFQSKTLNERLRNEPDNDWAVLVPHEGVGVQLTLSLVSSNKARQHHLDLYTTDQAAGVERSLAMGAKRMEWRYQPDADFMVLADLEGHNCCVIQVEGFPAWLAGSGMAEVNADQRRMSGT